MEVKVRIVALAVSLTIVWELIGRREIAETKSVVESIALNVTHSPHSNRIHYKREVCNEGRTIEERHSLLRDRFLVGRRCQRAAEALFLDTLILLVLVLNKQA